MPQVFECCCAKNSTILSNISDGADTSLVRTIVDTSLVPRRSIIDLREMFTVIFSNKLTKKI